MHPKIIKSSMQYCERRVEDKTQTKKMMRRFSNALSMNITMVYFLSSTLQLIGKHSRGMDYSWIYWYKLFFSFGRFSSLFVDRRRCRRWLLLQGKHHLLEILNVLLVNNILIIQNNLVWLDHRRMQKRWCRRQQSRRRWSRWLRFDLWQSLFFCANRVGGAGANGSDLTCGGACFFVRFLCWFL